MFLRWVFMSSHPLTNFETQRYQNEPGFNGVYSRNKSSTVKDGANVVNFVE